MDKSPADLRKSNPVSEHRHVYELVGTHVFGADCACGDHLNEGNGAVVGGRAKVLAAIKRHEARARIEK